MSENSLISFSLCGQYCSSYGNDGKLRIWNVQNNTLKQEYTPNLHLTSPITCLRWIKLSNFACPTKREKRKSMNDDAAEVDYLLLGTRQGQVQFYNVAVGDITNEMTKSHDSAITSLAWTKGLEFVYTSSEDSHLLEWSLKKNKLKKKWSGGSGRITFLEVSEDRKYLFSGSRSIQWWDLESKLVLKKFTGHSSAVIYLAHVTLPSGNYLLSAGGDDKYISAWSLNESNESKTNIASFVLDDTATNVDVWRTGENISMAAVSSSGTLHFFNLKLNGKCTKSLKADHVVQLAPKEGTKKLSLSPIPIIASRLSSSSSILITYGFGVQLQFETVSLESKDNLIILVRSDPRKKAVSRESSKVISTNTDDVSYSHPGVVNGISTSLIGVKRPRDKNSELPMEERLENLTLKKMETSAGSTVPPDSLAQLLIQGLKSKDKDLLYSVLCSKTDEIINNTVHRLPVQVILPLVEQLIFLTQSKSWGSEVSVRWLKAVLCVHAAQLVTSPDLSNKLSPLLGLIETRLNSLAPLLRLRGRLDLILDQLSSKPVMPVTPIDQSDFLVYEDKDSDEEEGSDDILLGQATDSSGDDRWNELSDQEDSDGTQDDVDMTSD